MASVIVPVELGERAYDVHVSDGDLSGLGDAMAGVFEPRKVVIVTDDRVGPLWGDAAEASLARAGFDAVRVTLPNGEAAKHVGTWTTAVDGILAAGADRRTPIVALGGGVVGDLAGFAAASTLRGLPYVQVPTTVLAMVDSSVGGKTGFNHARGKNLVGAFHQPRLVYAALQTLTTLEARERRAGLGEVVKTALIGDPSLLERLEAAPVAAAEGEPGALVPVVSRCVQLKAEVVAADERESGWRAVLNAGHTVGHALETVCGYGVLRHGEAVGLGLVAEAAWAVREGICTTKALPDRLSRLLEALGLPHVFPGADHDALVRCMGVDKKTLGDMLRLPVPVRPGQFVLVDLPAARLPDLLPESP